MDFRDDPENTRLQFSRLADVLERFACGVQAETGSSSISVNRTVRHLGSPVFLHSECSHTMISVADYERLLMPIDAQWSRRHPPFGIHHCGRDPHRFAASYAKLPRLDFLDVGWGGDVRGAPPPPAADLSEPAARSGGHCAANARRDTPNGLPPWSGNRTIPG